MEIFSDTEIKWINFNAADELSFLTFHSDKKMILTVTLNPLLEHRLTYKAFKVGTEHRFPKEEYKAGGKGINVSRQLNILSVNNLAFTFLGGNKGKMLKKLFMEEGINFTYISTHSECRECAVIIDETARTVTSCFGSNPTIFSNEADEFKLKLEKMIQNCDIVVFSGSSPCKETDQIFPFGIETANKFDKISICDTYGSHLRQCIESSPTIIHNNFKEIQESLKISLSSENEIIDTLNFLYSKNIKQAFLTDGTNPTYASNHDFHFKVTNPKVDTIDSTGSGDSFTAGIAYGWHHNLPFEETLILASALGAVNASRYDVCNVSINEANKLQGQFIVENLGKKMRLINVDAT